MLLKTTDNENDNGLNHSVDDHNDDTVLWLWSLFMHHFPSLPLFELQIFQRSFQSCDLVCHPLEKFCAVDLKSTRLMVKHSIKHHSRVHLQFNFKVKGHALRIVCILPHHKTTVFNSNTTTALNPWPKPLHSHTLWHPVVGCDSEVLF